MHAKYSVMQPESTTALAECCFSVYGVGPTSTARDPLPEIHYVQQDQPRKTLVLTL